VQILNTLEFRTDSLKVGFNNAHQISDSSRVIRALQDMLSMKTSLKHDFVVVELNAE